MTVKKEGGALLRSSGAAASCARACAGTGAGAGAAAGAGAGVSTRTCSKKPEAAALEPDATDGNGLACGTGNDDGRTYGTPLWNESEKYPSSFCAYFTRTQGTTTTRLWPLPGSEDRVDCGDAVLAAGANGVAVRGGSSGARLLTDATRDIDLDAGVDVDDREGVPPSPVMRRRTVGTWTESEQWMKTSRSGRRSSSTLPPKMSFCDSMAGCRGCIKRTRSFNSRTRAL